MRAVQMRASDEHLDAAVGKLDAAIASAGTKVNNDYAYLVALDKRASENQLPAGNATGATLQPGAFVYSIAGANNFSHQMNLAGLIGVVAVITGMGFGISLYRIRRGMPSSMAPAKA
jgi:hypothetical protein